MSGLAKIISGDYHVAGNITLDGSDLVSGDVATVRLPSFATLEGPEAFATRAQTTQEALKAYPIDFAEMRIHDDFSSLIPGSPTSDDLGFVDGDWSAVATHLISSVANGGTVTQYAAFLFVLPPEYDPGQSVSVTIRCKHSSTPEQDSGIDLIGFKHDGDGAIGSDLVTTGASPLTASYADYTFTVTPTGLVVGDTLQFRVEADIDDTAGSNSVVITITKVSVLLDIRT